MKGLGFTLCGLGFMHGEEVGVYGLAQKGLLALAHVLASAT